MIKNKPLELYIHIPFCVKKCAYCDFLSAPGDLATKDAYMKALLEEVRGKADSYKEYVVCSIFIGGGTPSVVDACWIEDLMEQIRSSYRVEKTAEITMEVNPGTVEEEKLFRYRKAGINRLSIGLQSADDKELIRLGRIHTYRQFLDTYFWARRAGFDNINVDVMSALPGQSVESYCDTLKKVLGLSPMPEHISAYSLIVEEGTPFYDLWEKGNLALPDEDEERKMYEETGRILGEAGFCRYEISNYARAGFACRHNCGYWKRTEYLGFGIGAASLIGQQRISNQRNLSDYLANPLDSEEERISLSVEEQMEETLFLGLRMMEGVDKTAFLQQFGIPVEKVYGAVIEKNKKEGLLLEEQGRLFLTPKGIDVSNYVMAQFLLT